MKPGNFAEVQVASAPARDIEHMSEKVRDGDEALDFLRKEEVGDEATLVDEKRLVRKIDIMIVPLMFFCYLAQYIDKSLLNYASVMGILTDAHLDTNQYANLSIMFYVAFLIFEFPHAYMMQRFPLAKYLGTMVILWGIVVACTSACKSYGTLVALRFLLGALESAISPSLVLVTSMWYKRDEQPARIGCWYIGVGIGGVIGSLISYGFQHYKGKTFTSWQIMFLVLGLITVVIGVCVVLLLPDNPMSSRLTHAEKVIAVERLRENNTGIENKHFKWYQVKECFLDPQVWLLFCITTSASIPTGALTSFGSILTKSFGYTSLQTALLQIPTGVIAATAIVLATWSAGRFNARGFGIITWAAIGALLGGSLLAFTGGKAKTAKLAGNYFTYSTGAFLPCVYSYSAANFAGHTKKVTMNALILIAFCIGNIAGPKTFRNQDAPDYLPAKITFVVTGSIAIVLTVILLGYYGWENKRRIAAPQAHVPDMEFADKTDRENKELRYKY